MSRKPKRYIVPEGKKPKRPTPNEELDAEREWKRLGSLRVWTPDKGWPEGGSFNRYIDETIEEDGRHVLNIVNRITHTSELGLKSEFRFPDEKRLIFYRKCNAVELRYDLDNFWKYPELGAKSYNDSKNL
jgi:hypothetical protein